MALRVLEVIRDQDVPGEILGEEDPAQTLPRRLGLSEVVERQIRSYRQDVRRRLKLTDEEITDLFRLVARRPDATEIFEKVGRVLSDRSPSTTAWRLLLPGRIAFAVARTVMRRRLKALFGRRMGGFARGPFAIEGRAHLFIESDPEGAACNLVTGLCEATLEGVSGRAIRVRHSRCQSRGDQQCRWEGRLKPDQET